MEALPMLGTAAGTSAVPRPMTDWVVIPPTFELHRLEPVFAFVTGAGTSCVVPTAVGGGPLPPDAVLVAPDTRPTL